MLPKASLLLLASVIFFIRCRRISAAIGFIITSQMPKSKAMSLSSTESLSAMTIAGIFAEAAYRAASFAKVKKSISSAATAKITAVTPSPSDLTTESASPLFAASSVVHLSGESISFIAALSSSRGLIMRSLFLIGILSPLFRGITSTVLKQRP